MIIYVLFILGNKYNQRKETKSVKLKLSLHFCFGVFLMVYFFKHFFLIAFRWSCFWVDPGHSGLFWLVPACSDLLRNVLGHFFFTNCNFSECFNFLLIMNFMFDFLTKWGSINVLQSSGQVLSEAVVRMCSVKMALLKILQNSQENTCTTVSFLIKLQTGLQLY